MRTQLLSANAAQAEHSPNQWVFETQLEEGYDADNSNDERTNLFGRSELLPTIPINDKFFVDGTIVLEPLQDSPAGEDTFFDQEGIFIENVKLNYQDGAIHAFAGKFNPDFGKAWDWGRGIWSEDFAEDYEVTQKIGFGGAYTLDMADAGSHTFTASTFYNDTTILSESIITRIDRVRQADGGAGNTQDFSSYVLSLAGEEIAEVEGLSYQVAVRHLAGADNSTTGTNDEDGFTAGFGYVFPVSENVEMDALVEFADIKNFEGSAEDKQFIYANLITRIDENWNVTAGYTQRKTEAAGAADVNDDLLQLSGGYDFGNGFTLETGIRSSEEANEDKNIIGGLARYVMEF
jgi:hypothetical protein